LVNTTSDGKQFSFSSSNIDHFMNHLDDRFVIWVNVQDWCDDMVLDTSIRYDNRRRKVWWCPKYNKSIRWFPGLNSSLKNEKDGKSLLPLLSMSMRVDFKQSLCLGVRWSMEMLWQLWSCNLLELRILLMI